MNNIDSFLDKSNKFILENNKKKKIILDIIYKNSHIELSLEDVVLFDDKIKIKIVGLRKNIILKNKDCILKEIQSLYTFNQIV
jgi:hypothetical protein